MKRHKELINIMERIVQDHDRLKKDQRQCLERITLLENERAANIEKLEKVQTQKDETERRVSGLERKLDSIEKQTQENGEMVQQLLSKLNEPDNTAENKLSLSSAQVLLEKDLQEQQKNDKKLQGWLVGSNIVSWKN